MLVSPVCCLFPALRHACSLAPWSQMYFCGSWKVLFLQDSSLLCGISEHVNFRARYLQSTLPSEHVNLRARYCQTMLPSEHINLRASLFASPVLFLCPLKVCVPQGGSVLVPADLWLSVSAGGIVVSPCMPACEIEFCKLLYAWS